MDGMDQLHIELILHDPHHRGLEGPAITDDENAKPAGCSIGGERWCPNV
jgi:hypothetical protein